jgi:hypothetical protein
MRLHPSRYMVKLKKKDARLDLPDPFGPTTEENEENGPISVEPL